eukprot:gnl/Hemi2/21570_TR7184_c0_g1_i1.p1 gnl/Hemi2/21570_TR7184_c0_g1~~gnl/Hemi2/21570_TR7184_c0_g1_i1.p1  ORF type:complete len:212 (+),score=76.49 gnl/Hemi2/21570_TR7184_c0_g1_i1:60-638(+)
MKSSKARSPLESNLVFYMSYHGNATNRLIHIVCVPIILWTAFAFFTKTGPLVANPLSDNPLFEINGAVPATLFFVLNYLYMEPFAGFLEMFPLFGLYVAANYFVQSCSNAILYAVILHIVCWVLQIIGHEVFEQRSPAFMDSIGQSLVAAPLFVWLEVLFFFGYKPSLCKTLEAESRKNIAAYQAERNKKSK